MVYVWGVIGGLRSGISCFWLGGGLGVVLGLWVFGGEGRGKNFFVGGYYVFLRLYVGIYFGDNVWVFKGVFLVRRCFV